MMHKIGFILIILGLVIVIGDFITVSIPVIGTIRSFVVLSGSMEPKLPVGSIVVTESNVTYAPGDIIAFERDGVIVTHRITKKRIDSNIFSFVTKGDANNTNDLQEVPQNKVVGKVLFFVPYVGRFFSFIKTPPGFIIFVVLPGLIFIGYELWDIKKELEKEIEKKLLRKMGQII